jgi:hypothetical protein
VWERHERSYNENYTPSRPLWEVKSHLAWSVVRWVTTCEARVLFVLFCCVVFAKFFFFLFSFASLHFTSDLSSLRCVVSDTFPFPFRSLSRREGEGRGEQEREVREVSCIIHVRGTMTTATRRLDTSSDGTNRPPRARHLQSQSPLHSSPPHCHRRLLSSLRSIAAPPPFAWRDSHRQ